MTETPTIVRPDVDTDEALKEFVTPYEDSDDPNTRTHYVRPYENGHIWQKGMTAKEVVELARINGIEIMALCGYTWVPKLNPDKYDLCSTCNDLAHKYMKESGK